MRQVRKTTCCFCGYCCGLLATVEDGRVVDVAPDPSRYPYDERIAAGCRRWRMNLSALDDPARMNHPLRRAGARGSGAWERVSWDEALDDIAHRLRRLARAHGPETLASAIGGPHTSYWPLHRFMNLFGSPNNMGIGQICWNPRIWMDAVTFGWTVEADIAPGVTDCLFIWGSNPAQSDNSAFWRSIVRFARSDAALVVIDPRRTQTATLADVWLAPKPGTDCTLALGLLHVIIGEDLVDRAFIERWCHGFEELAAHVASYTPECVARICGVDAAALVRAARLFGRARAAALVSGRGIDQSGANVAPTHRALCCLRAVTGNVDRPGSCVLTEASDFVPEVDLELPSALSAAQRGKCLNEGVTPLQSYTGYERVAALTQRLGRTLPFRYLTAAHPHLVLRAMEQGDPYPVRALIVDATNPLLTYADTRRVFDAFMQLDMLVVLEQRMTPTASIADYVLPIAGAMERPVLQVHGGVANVAYGGPAAVEPLHERRTDYDVFRALGMRLGQQDAWPEETLAEAFASQLDPAGVGWEAFCEKGLYGPAPAYRKHESVGPDGRARGFATSTGKIELASELLGAMGGPRVPYPAAVSPRCSNRTRVRAKRRGGACVSLITGARKQPYNASMYFDNPAFREKDPAPVAEVSPATAQRLGLAEGDAVVLATDRGEARFVLKTAAMRDDLVSVDYGWWHPEWPPGAPAYGGIEESNANCLTSCAVEEPMIGTWSYNALDCTIAKADEAPSWNRYRREGAIRA